MRISQDISTLVQQPYVVPSGLRSQVSPSEIRLKGLLETLRPPNKDIPISSYSFPKLKQLVEDLQEQLANDETKTILWLGTDQYMFLKNLLLQIEQKISNRKIPRTSSYGVSIDVLLILVGKLQNASTSGKQSSKLKQLLLVMDKFIAIEKCLLGETETNLEARNTLLYDLDILFEAFLIEIISASDEWSPSSINQKLKRRLIAVSDKNVHPAIEKCVEELVDVSSPKRTNESLYIKIRNELLLLCNEFSVQLPTPLTITMEYIRGTGKVICENTTSIENIIAVFVMMGYSKKNALLISGLIKFYCDMQKDAKMSSITRFLLVLAQVKKSQDKEQRKKKDTTVSETLEFAKKAEKVINKKASTTMSHILQINQALGIPLTEEDERYLKTTSQEVTSPPSRRTASIASYREEPESEEKEKENKIPLPRGPRANPYSLYGKYTSILGRTTNILDAGLITSVKNMIEDFELEPVTAGFLLTGFFALRRSFQIEGWNTLVRSYNYQLRSSLGEKLKGRRPTEPLKLISSGRWGEQAHEEKKVFLTLNRATLVSNIMLMGTTFYSYVTYKILNAMNMDSSEELLKETVDETVEEDTEY